MKVPKFLRWLFSKSEKVQPSTILKFINDEPPLILEIEPHPFTITVDGTVVKEEEIIPKAA